MKGHRVRYTLAAKLVNELVEAADDKQLTKTIARYGRVDLLCIDELGYMELDRRGAELLFQVLTEREEKASVAIASKESFGGWTKTFTDPRLCAAIVDRLTFGGTILETGTDSYRLAQTRARAAPAGLRHLGPHALRHPAATMAYALGVDWKQIQAMLGHTMLSTTMDIYVDMVEDVSRDAAPKLDAWFDAAHDDEDQEHVDPEDGEEAG